MTFMSLAPPPPAAPCNPLTEGSCQGGAGGPAPTATPPASQVLLGPGNQISPPEKKSKKKKKKSKKKGKKGKKGGKASGRDTNSNRGAIR
jgi:hypothetical protein